jgi:hypothetical protein
MRIALIATMIAALTIPAYAQWLGKDSDSGFPQRDAEIAAKKQLAKETDKGYQAAIKNIPDKLPDKKQSDDPWNPLIGFWPSGGRRALHVAASYRPCRAHRPDDVSC